MSIYGAMFSGVSGLRAQSQAMGIISDNISNVNTVGYKGSRASFSTLVTQSATQSQYTPGGVRARPLAEFDRQGLIQGSSNPTHSAVIGDGFFVVREQAADVSDNTFMYTRAGQFEADADGNLRNAAGFYLQGWRLNPDGTLAQGVNQNVLSGLDTVNIADLTGSVRATSEIDITANLPPNAQPFAPAVSTGLALTGDLGTAAPFTSTVTVYDADGAMHSVDLQFAGGTGPGSSWNVTVTDVRDSTGTSVGGPLAPVTLNIDGAGNPDGTGTLETAGIDLTGIGTLGPLAVDVTGLTNDGLAAQSLASVQTGGMGVGDSYPMTVTIYDSLGTAYNLELRFAKDAVTTGQWDVYVADLVRLSDLARYDTATSSWTTGTPTAPIADPAVPATWDQFGSVQFDGNGLLTGGNLGDPVNLSLDLQTLGFDPDNGANWDANGPIAINLGTFGGQDGLAQVGDEFLTRRIDQDGLQYGSFVGVTIDEMGIVTAQFDNGQSLDIYQVPLATFANTNGLSEVTGNAFLETRESGAYFLREANTGGAGTINSGALESSTVDLGTEFTNMIITQRAYSASAKIITTSDEMLDELIRIKR